MLHEQADGPELQFSKKLGGEHARMKEVRDIYITLSLRYVKYIWSEYNYQNFNASSVAKIPYRYKCSYLLKHSFSLVRSRSILYVNNNI